MNRFRRLLVRWEKKLANYLALVQFACAWITYRAAGALPSALNAPPFYRAAASRARAANERRPLSL